MALCNTVNKNLANPTNFDLVFPMIPGQTNIGAGQELILNLHGCMLPAISMNPFEANWQGTKVRYGTSPPEFEVFTAQFVVDSQFKNWRVLQEWITYIADNKEKMMEFHRNYAVDATLRVLDNFNSAVIGITFVSMWPTNLQEVNFSMKEGEVLLEGGATFYYDYFEVKENI